MMEKLLNLWHSTGIYQLETGQALMIAVCLGLVFLAIRKGFEPLLLIPIGFGGVLANIPAAGMAETGGLLAMLYDVGLPTSVFPLLIFMGVGAMTDFGPMLANPKTLLLWRSCSIWYFWYFIGCFSHWYVRYSWFGVYPARSCVDRYYWWGRWSNINLCDIALSA